MMRVKVKVDLNVKISDDALKNASEMYLAQLDFFHARASLPRRGFRFVSQHFHIFTFSSSEFELESFGG